MRDGSHPASLAPDEESATGALAGRAVSVTKQRGPMSFGEMQGFVTVHPSFLLRVPEENKDEEYERFVDDLKLAKPFLG